MKKLGKLFAYILLISFSVVLLLVIIAIFSQNKIADVALEKVSETMDAPIEVDQISFTLLKRFPYSTIEFSGVRLGAETENGDSSAEHPNEDILHIAHAFVSVKPIPLLNGEYEIVKIEVDGANMRYSVDSLGKNNLAFLMDSVSPTEENLDVAQQDTVFPALPDVDLHNLFLKNIVLTYSDDTGMIHAKMEIPELHLNGMIRNEEYSGSINGNIVLSQCAYGNTNLKLMKKSTLDFDLDYKNDTLLIKSFEVNSDGAQIAAKGKATFMNALYADLTFNSKGLHIEELMKYAPTEMLDSFGINSAKGTIAMFGSVEGHINDSIQPRLNLNLDLKDGLLRTTDYPTLKKIEFTAHVNNGATRNNASTGIDFSHFLMETQNSKVNAHFSLRNLDKPKYSIDASASAMLDEFKDFIPDTLLTSLSGLVHFNVKTQGEMPDSITNEFIESALASSSGTVQFEHLSLNMDTLQVKNMTGQLHYAPGIFQVNNFMLNVPSHNINLNRLSLDTELTGPLTQLNKLDIKLKTFNAQTPQFTLSGSGSVHNLEHPDFVLAANAQFHLSELKPFLPDTLVKSASGTINAHLESFGQINLDSIETEISPILFNQSSIELSCQDVSIATQSPEVELNIFNGSMQMANDSIRISNVMGNAAGLDFQLDSTQILNTYKTLFENKRDTLFVYSKLNLGDINHTLFEPFLQEVSEQNINIQQTGVEEPTSTDAQNYAMNFKGKIGVKSIAYNHQFINNMTKVLELEDSMKIMLNSYLNQEIRVKNLSAKYNISDSLYLVDQFKLEAFKGSINNALRMRMLPNGKQEINVKNTIHKMDMSQLLYDCQSFGQTEMITHKNLTGLLSGTTYTKLVMIGDSMVQKDLRVKGDYMLENGGIYNFEPAMDALKSTGLKDLDNIQFKTLKTQLFVLKEHIYIPKTEIVSTSMDVAFFGMQSLVKDFEYHLKLHLSQVLAGKNPKLLAEQKKNWDDSGSEKERRAIKLIYADVDGEKKRGFDNKNAQRLMSAKINTKQKLLNLRFHPEFVSFETGVK